MGRQVPGVQGVRLSGFGPVRSLGLSEEDFRFQSRDWNRTNTREKTQRLRFGPDHPAMRTVTLWQDKAHPPHPLRDFRL